MKFKVGDKVKTYFGNGEIVFIDYHLPIQYLVKIKDFKGHDGGGIRLILDYWYFSKDDLDDKWWFLERHLELEEEQK